MSLNIFDVYCHFPKKTIFKIALDPLRLFCNIACGNSPLFFQKGYMHACHPSYTTPFIYIQPGIDGDCLHIDKPFMDTRRVKLTGELHIHGPLHDIIACVDQIIKF